jgi:hypothetical protein
VACYPGPAQSRSSCSAAAKTERFDDPIDVRTKWHSGLMCPAVWNSDGRCRLGNFPVYVVKAVRKEDVQEGIRFAERWGLRVAIKNTGHDFLVSFVLFSFLLLWEVHGLIEVLGKEYWIWEFEYLDSLFERDSIPGCVDAYCWASTDYSPECCCDRGGHAVERSL